MHRLPNGWPVFFYAGETSWAYVIYHINNFVVPLTFFTFVG